MAERDKWTCEKCKIERFLKLQEDLKNALRQTDDLKFRNRELEEKLLLVEVGKRDAVFANQKSAKYVVVGDSILRNVRVEHTDMMVACFSGD
jgi:hypothetical protein